MLAAVFKLFNIFWPEYKGKIYLNTETKFFDYPGLNIISVKNNHVKAPWSKCLINAINKIEEDHFIYMQEDYFLHNYVNHKEVLNFYEKFRKYDLDCLHLTDQCTKGPFDDFRDNILLIDKNAPYRASTQAAFWKKDSFLEILRPWESGWDFEKFGSKRTINNLNMICTVSHNKYKKNDNELLPYIFTGIIKNKWKNEVIDLFNKHNIVIDFTKRGFVEDNSKPNLYKKLLIAKKL